MAANYIPEVDAVSTDRDDSELEKLREALHEQATADGIQVYIAPRRSGLDVESPDLTATGLRLWIEHNGAEVRTVTADGYATVVPEVTDAD